MRGRRGLEAPGARLGPGRHRARGVEQGQQRALVHAARGVGVRRAERHPQARAAARHVFDRDAAARDEGELPDQRGPSAPDRTRRRRRRSGAAPRPGRPGARAPRCVACAIGLPSRVATSTATKQSCLPSRSSVARGHHVLVDRGGEVADLERAGVPGARRLAQREARHGLASHRRERGRAAAVQRLAGVRVGFGEGQLQHDALARQLAHAHAQRRGVGRLLDPAPHRLRRHVGIQGSRQEWIDSSPGTWRASVRIASSASRRREVVGVHALDRAAARLDQLDRAAIAGRGDPDRAAQLDLLQHDLVGDELRDRLPALDAGQHDGAAGRHVVERLGDRGASSRRTRRPPRARPRRW